MARAAFAARQRAARDTDRIGRQRVAEDTGEVVSLTGSETTPLTGHVGDLVVTKDADLLDPAAPEENKYYMRGKGLILTVESGARDVAVRAEKF